MQPHHPLDTNEDTLAGHDADRRVGQAPVTTRSRITGSRSAAAPVHVPAHAMEPTRSIDWASVVASTVAGVATTATLILLGIATGLIAANENTDTEGALGILSGIGAWAVVAAILGTLVGSMLGGRLARWLDRGSVAYHALTSWGLATLTSLVLLTLVVLAFASSATSVAAGDVAANDTQNAAAAADTNATTPAERDAAGGTDPAGDNGTSSEAADDAGDALGTASLALAIGMLLTLAASFAGWWIGSRKKLTDFERETPHEVAATA